MQYKSSLAVVLAVVGFVNSQIDPNSVPIATRNQWCTNQRTQCPLICLQYPGNSAATTSNTCDATTLAYSCVCSNGMTPNASEYSQTIPYYICTETNNQCVAACGTDNICASNCRANHPCGAQNPVLVNTSTISSTMSSTSTGAGKATATNSAAYTGFGGAAATTTAASSSNNNGNNQGAAAAAMNLGQSYGMAIVLAAFFGGAALIL